MKVPTGLTALPLGGAGEIGMNFMVYECDGSLIVVDVGLSFPDEFAPGVDLVLPDIRYVRENKHRLKAIIITHAHEDHIGGLPYLWEDMPAPVYVSPFARLVLESKLDEVGLLGDVPIIGVKPGERFKVGPFDIEYIPVTHSIPESHALAIRTPYGNIVHTGDYKFDADPALGAVTDEARLKAVGDEGVLAMFGDSTNVFKPKVAGSEGEVAKSLDSVIAGCQHRIFFCTFASNLARVKTSAELAARHGRKLALFGRSLHNMTGHARKLGYISKELFETIISPEAAMDLPRNKVMFCVTGSQGEARAALSKLAAGEAGAMALEAGDTVIFSSRIIPGNEKTIFALMNRLARKGARIINEKSDFVHVSGHAARDEIAKMYSLVRPQMAIPVHGEYQHMREQADFAKSLGVPRQFVIENGDRVHLAPGEPKVTREAVEAGRNYVDGLSILDEDRFILRERRQLSLEGVATVTLALDAQSGEIVAGPHIRTKGLIDEAVQEELLATVADEVKDALLTRFKKGVISDIPHAEETMRQAVRRVFARERGRKPLTLTTVVSV